jgi:hypothetical protein
VVTSGFFIETRELFSAVQIDGGRPEREDAFRLVAE